MPVPSQHSLRMLKKARLLTRPTLAATAPARPESAKTASLPWDAPYSKQGRSECSTMVLPSLLVYVAQDGPDESLTARVQRGSSETARCASTGDSPGHPSPAGGLFQDPVSGRDGPL